MLHFTPLERWNEAHGILHQNLQAPIESQVGDFGEYTGLMLMYWALINYDPLAEKVVKGLVDMYNATKQELIPRGISLTRNNPEPGKVRWVKIGEKWYRVFDMNQTQLFYLFIGLVTYFELSGDSNASYLLTRAIGKVVDDGGKIKYGDRVTKQGYYFKHEFKEWYLKPFEYLPIGNMYPRGLSLFKAMDESLFSPRTWFALATVNWWGRWKRMDETDRNNTSFALWALASVDEKYDDKFIKWEKKESNTFFWLKARYEGNRPMNPDVMQDDLKYLLREKMRGMYGL